MQVTSFSLLVTAFLVLSIFSRSNGINLCHIDCPECYMNCKHGTFTDHCGREVCSKGPGQQCGGRLDILGRCGDGLSCNSCNRCTGCSLWTGACAHKKYYLCDK